MNSDIRLSIGFFDHAKTKRLKKRLGSDGVECLIRLWMYVATNKPDGRLTGWDWEDVELAASWNGEPKSFFDTVIDEKCRWIDMVDGVYQIHDWEEHNGWACHAKEREDHARHAVESRWRKKREYPSDTPSINENTGSNTPSPSPSPSPLPLPKDTPPISPPQPTEEKEFIRFPLNDKSEYPVTVTAIAEMKSLFPAVDIEQEFRGMRAWCLANPTKLKTRTGIKKFYTTWLSDKQNKSARVVVAPIKPEPEPATPIVPKVIPKTDEKLHARFYAKVILPMRDEMQSGSWCAFIEPLRVVSFDKATNQITLYADTNIKAWVDDHYLSEIVALAGCQVRIIDGEE
jgi:hypothetical protein